MVVCLTDFITTTHKYGFYMYGVFLIYLAALFSWGYLCNSGALSVIWFQGAFVWEPLKIWRGQSYRRYAVWWSLSLDTCLENCRFSNWFLGVWDVVWIRRHNWDRRCLVFRRRVGRKCIRSCRSWPLYRLALNGCHNFHRWVLVLA